MANQKQSNPKNGGGGAVNPTVGTQTQRVSTPPPSPGIASSLRRYSLGDLGRRVAGGGG